MHRKLHIQRSRYSRDTVTLPHHNARPHISRITSQKRIAVWDPASSTIFTRIWSLFGGKTIKQWSSYQMAYEAFYHTWESDFYETGIMLLYLAGRSASNLLVFILINKIYFRCFKFYYQIQYFVWPSLMCRTRDRTNHRLLDLNLGSEGRVLISKENRKGSSKASPTISHTNWGWS